MKNLLVQVTTVIILHYQATTVNISLVANKNFLREELLKALSVIGKSLAGREYQGRGEF